MLLNFEELWLEGGYFDPKIGKNTLESAATLLYKIASQLNLPSQAVDTVMQEVFLEMAEGRQWPFDGCNPEDCACDIGNPGTAVIHDMERRLRALNEEWQAKQIEILTKNLNMAITGHIKRIEREHLKGIGLREAFNQKVKLPNWLNFLDKKVF